MPSLLAAAIGEMRRLKEEADLSFCDFQALSPDGLAQSYWQGRCDALSEIIPVIERVDQALDAALARCGSVPDKAAR